MAAVSDVIAARHLYHCLLLCADGGIMIAFKNYSFRKGVWGSERVGLKYFKQFFSNPDMMKLLKNTLILSLYSLLASFPAPIILALALNIIGGEKFKKFMQSLTYAPYFISTVVMVGIILQCLHLNIGIVNNILDFLGLARIDFMGRASYFRHIYVWSGVWQGIDYSAIIYIASLSNVDQSLVEASLIDGANRWQRIKIVELPALKPIITIQLIMAVGSIMGVGFEKVFLMQNSGVIDSFWAMILPSAMGVWNVILIKTYIQSSIPSEIFESVSIDGCSDWKYFISMIIPLSKPIIAVMVLLIAVGKWNDFFSGLLYLNDVNKQPLQLLLRNVPVQNDSIGMAMTMNECYRRKISAAQGLCGSDLRFHMVHHG